MSPGGVPLADAGEGRDGAKLIHVDPRFTRTSAMGDIYAPIRAGSDIAFLGGLINHVLKSERWNTDPFFREYVRQLHQRADDHRRRTSRTPRTWTACSPG